MRGCRSVQLVVMFDCRSESVFQNLSEDVFEMDRNIALVTSQTMDGVDGGRIGTHANVASSCPSIMMVGAAPSVASQSSLTNALHILTMAVGEQAMLTIP